MLALMMVSYISVGSFSHDRVTYRWIKQHEEYKNTTLEARLSPKILSLIISEYATTLLSATLIRLGTCSDLQGLTAGLVSSSASSRDPQGAD